MTMIRTSKAVKTAAATNAVSLSDAKAHLRVDHTDEDDLITDLITAAQAQVEAYTNRVLITSTHYLYLTDFPSGGIVLPLAPVTSITSVKYVTGGSDVTWDSSNYYYSINELPVNVSSVGDSAPGVDEDVFPAVTVEYVAGYADQDAVPAALKQAVLLLVADMYEYRQDAPRERFTAWKSLCYPYRVFHPITANE